ncbi:MAG: HupE/UreJ family protein [Acidimicrobiia bacterium]
MRAIPIARGSLLLALAMAGTRAEAHSTFSASGPFVGGVKHFFISLDDGLLALAVGIVAGLGDAKFATRVILLLPGSWLLAGGIGIVAKIPVPGSETISAFTLLLAGLWAAVNPRIPATAGLILCGGLGALHGYGNGSALDFDSRWDAVNQLLGICVSCLLVAFYPSALLELSKQAWPRLVARVLGSWIAATGLLLLGWSLRMKR